MKTKLFLLAILATASANAQQFTEKIDKAYTFEKPGINNTLVVANINGSITVTGYEGDQVLVEMTRTITAKTDQRLEKGKQEVQLRTIDRADTIILYVEDGCNTFGRKETRGNPDWSPSGWGYHWENDDRDCRIPYDYVAHFTIKVPASLNVMVSTVNEGRIDVTDVSGSVSAHNINGSIRLTRMKRESVATTINGDLDVEYVASPQKDCRFYTLNGDINARFPKDLGASMSFESFNGNFFTDIEQLTPLPIAVVKADEGDGTKYKVSGNRYRIGDGGKAFLDFETFNGNVYLKTN